MPLSSWISGKSTQPRRLLTSMSLMAKLEKEENDFKEKETANQSKSWENDLGASKILNEKEENKGANCNQLTDEQEVAGKV